MSDKQSGFPMARKQQQLRKQGRSMPPPEVRRPAREPQPVIVSLTELQERGKPGPFRDNYARMLTEQAAHGLPHRRREATVAIEMLRMIEAGTIDKHFIETHPRLYVDIDGDAYDLEGNATRGELISELRSSTPPVVEFDDSDRRAYEKATRDERDRQWKNLCENNGTPLSETMKSV